MKPQPNQPPLPFFLSPNCPILTEGSRVTTLDDRNDTHPPTLKQAGIQWKALQMMMDKGSITALDIQNLGTTDARKLAWRLKLLGFIGKTEMEPNANSGGKHARYFWSGKYPS